MAAGPRPDDDFQPDLSTATFDQLWDEIRSRCTGVVMAFDRRPKNDDDYAEVETYHHCQSNAHALGLSCMAFKQFESGITTVWDPRARVARDEDEDED